MKTHFLRFIQRGIIKMPVIYSINFLGLVLSMGVVIILAGFYLGEINANTFNQNIDDTYIICSEESQNQLSAYTAAILKEHIEENIPEVIKVVRMRSPWNETTLQVGENPPIISSIIFVDSTFIDVFSYRCIDGELEKALNTPMSIVLSKNEAQKLFGNTSPIGETVKIDNKHLLTVRAVINEPSEKTSLSFKAIVPMISISKISPNGDELTSWMFANFTTFVLLEKNAILNEVEKKIAQLYPESKEEPKIFLQSFSSLYFSDINISELSYLKTGNKSTTMILGVVAIIIFLIGIINYLNLSFSMTIERLRNTGIMKVMGAKKIQIFKNIVGESALFFFVSIVVAYFTVWLTLPFLISKIGIEINRDIIFNPALIFISLFFVLIIAILAVSVPAKKLSSINAIDSIKRDLSGKGKNDQTRRVLVIAQFTIAITLIAFTSAVQKQVKYGFKQLGYNEENIITIQLTPQLKKDILKEKILQTPDVIDVSYTNYLPGQQSIEQWSGISITYEGEKIENISTHIIRSDSNLPELLGLKLLKGRLFSSNRTTDKNKVLINKAFVDEYGLEEPLGLKVPAFWSDDMEIIGVVDNFHFLSIHNSISPLIIRIHDYTKYGYVKIASSDFNSLHRTVKQIDDIASELSTEFPVNISFLDSSIAEMYKDEVQFRETFFFFSAISIFICCLGILGLSILTCQKKIKEIGIRKVNGARISEVLIMLNKDFVKWVAIAFVLATPIAYYAMHKWLQNFAYKTELSWWIFALAGLMALGIALLTVSWQSWRAATRNPVESLRYE